jgi:hypothetical protein
VNVCPVSVDMKRCLVCSLAARVVKGPYDWSVRRMIEGTLRYGSSHTEIMGSLFSLRRRL